MNPEAPRFREVNVLLVRSNCDEAYRTLLESEDVSDISVLEGFYSALNFRTNQLFTDENYGVRQIAIGVRNAIATEPGNENVKPMLEIKPMKLPEGFVEEMLEQVPYIDNLTYKKFVEIAASQGYDLRNQTDTFQAVKAALKRYSDTATLGLKSDPW